MTQRTTDLIPVTCVTGFLGERHSSCEIEGPDPFQEG